VLQMRFAVCLMWLGLWGLQKTCVVSLMANFWA